MRAKGGVVGGALLVAGTSIGGGMLALPVLTSLGGFYPSLIIFLACWLFMASTGLLMLEVCLWMERETNLVSMAERTLGTMGKVVTWILYIFMFYTLTVAYVNGSGDVVVDLFGNTVPAWLGMVGFVAIFGSFVFVGAYAVDKLNVLLMVGLGVTYCIFVWLGISHVNVEHFQHSNWPMSLLALPVAFTSFGYQGIIPTLATYLHRDVKKLRAAILLGSFLPFVTYGIWEWLIHGIIPAFGPGSLAEALKNNDNAVRPLRIFIDNPWIIRVGEFFAFFALTTSFLGVTLGLRDFFADGLQVKKTRQGRLLLCLLIFVPPVIFSVVYPRLFIEAVGLAGGFGAALLLGLLPIIMVWSGRYRRGIGVKHLLPGGRALLVVLIAFVVVEVICQIAHLAGKL